MQIDCHAEKKSLSPDNSVMTGGTPLHWAVARGGDGQVRENEGWKLTFLLVWYWYIYILDSRLEVLGSHHNMG